MRAFRSRSIAISVVSLATLAALTACGSSSTDTDGTSGSGATSDSSEGGTDEAAGVGTGAMADAGFAVTVFLDTMWPIEGNDYADAASVEGWCATFATDPDAAVVAVAEYLNAEPEIAAADPESVNTSIAEYLDGNCYLLEE